MSWRAYLAWTMVLLLASTVEALAGSTLSGTVRLLIDGDQKPLERAWVVARGGIPPIDVVAARTDVDGRFELAGLPEGRVEVRVVHVGHYTLLSGGEGEPKLLRKCPAEGLCGEADFLVAKGGVVEGWVNDAFSDPVSHVTVYLTRLEGQDRPAVGPPQVERAETVSDDRGYFRFHGLAPGEYSLDFRHQPKLSPLGETLRAPGTRIEIGEGETTTPVYVSMEPSMSVEPPRAGDSSLSGRAVSSEGFPVAGAAVLLERLEEPSTTAGLAWTTLDGTFRFADLAAGPYRVQAVKSGFYPRSAQRELRAGSAARSVEIELSPLAVIAGAVSTAEGEPMTGARVEVWCERWRLGRRRLAPAAAAIVDDRGAYRVFGLPPGRCFAQSSPASNPAAAGRAELLSPALLEPRPNINNELAFFEVGVGARLETVDFRGVEPADTEIKGALVLAPKMTPCQDCTLGFYRSTGGVDVAAYEMKVPRGVFSVRGLAPGRYSLAVVGAGGRPERRYTGLDVASIAPERVSDAGTIRLTQGASIRGVVRLESPPSTVFDDEGRWREAVTLHLDYFGPHLLRFGRIAAETDLPSVGKGGSFLVKGLAPGQYAIRDASLPPGGYVRSVQSFRRALSDGLVRVQPLRQRAALAVEVGFDSGTVSGKVESRRRDEVAGAWVQMVPLDPVAVRTTRRARVDAAGRFAIGGVAPGRYALFAVPAGFDQDLADPLLRRSLARWEAEVVVGPGAAVETSLGLVER